MGVTEAQRATCYDLMVFHSYLIFTCTNVGTADGKLTTTIKDLGCLSVSSCTPPTSSEPGASTSAQYKVVLNPLLVTRSPIFGALLDKLFIFWKDSVLVTVLSGTGRLWLC